MGKLWVSKKNEIIRSANALSGISMVVAVFIGVFWVCFEKIRNRSCFFGYALVLAWCVYIANVFKVYKAQIKSYDEIVDDKKRLKDFFDLWLYWYFFNYHFANCKLKSAYKLSVFHFFCSLLIFLNSAYNYRLKYLLKNLKNAIVFRHLNCSRHVLLVVSFIVLNHFDYFDAFAFLIGIFPLILRAIILDLA